MGYGLELDSVDAVIKGRGGESSHPLPASTHQDTEVRAVSGVKVSAGSVWIGKHRISSVLSLVSFEKMPAGSVVKPFDSALHQPELV